LSVFLRWGIFGILAVAALVYAYNASKSMADKHAATSGAVASNAVPSDTETESDSATEAESLPAPTPAAAPSSRTPPHCEDELVVAQRALDARRNDEPFDRLLRIQEIAWQEPAARRHRLAQVAARWYELEGDEPIPEALRIAVISDCVRLSPAP
jgi:hypothetical protein